LCPPRRRLSFRTSSSLADEDGPALAVCYAEEFLINKNWEEFQPTLPGRADYVFGLHKFMRSSSLPHDEGLFLGLLPDLFLLLGLLYAPPSRPSGRTRRAAP
jgi:hypothetical protein